MSTTSTAKLRIVNVTDIYKLDNFPNIKTLIEEEKSALKDDGTLISILTGDFLAPYLLSSLDKGTSMISMLNSTPIDYVIWGNHEDDIEHKYACQRVCDYKGTWLNTNMQDHVMMAYQKPFEILTIQSPDGSNSRKIGLIAVLSNAHSLYRENPFGGATIDDPWDTIEKYKKILEETHGVDLIIPLCHLYEPQDEVTAKRFPDFPVILSGHDHHTVDRMIGNTRLLKAGADGEQAVILDISWASAEKNCPLQIDSRHVKTQNYTPNPELSETVRKSYSVLQTLRNTELCPIPSQFRPLSSVGSRARLNSVARFLWSAFREALNERDQSGGDRTVDCVLLTGGDLRGEKSYPEDSYFSLEDLRSEIQEQLGVLIVRIPGDVLVAGVKESHHAPNPTFIQYDDSIEEDETGTIVKIAGEPVDPKRLYRVAVSTYDIEGGNKYWVEYFSAHPESLPPSDAVFPMCSVLMGYFARNIWKQIWKLIDQNGDGVISPEELKSIDTDGDGRVSKQEIAAVMKTLGFEVDTSEVSFVDCIMDVAGDDNRDGFLSLEELNSHPVLK